MSITTQCPNCHSMNVYHRGILVVDLDEVELFFTCRKCGHEWKDTFELGPRIKTSVIQQGNKSRRHRIKFDVTKPGVVLPEIEHLYQTYKKILNLHQTKYRKKPVVVDAVQWNGSNVSEIYVFIGTDVNARYVGDTVIIPTLEGDMTASKGDWIIRGVNGEYYPCKPDVFAKTYEPVVE